MDDLRIKENCDCMSCLQNEINCWREFANRILCRFSFVQKERWFKTPEGKQYLSATSLLMQKIKSLKRGNNETKKLQAA